MMTYLYNKPKTYSFLKYKDNIVLNRYTFLFQNLEK